MILHCIEVMTLCVYNQEIVPLSPDPSPHREFGAGYETTRPFFLLEGGVCGRDYSYRPEQCSYTLYTVNLLIWQAHDTIAILTHSCGYSMSNIGYTTLL